MSNDKDHRDKEYDPWDPERDIEMAYDATPISFCTRSPFLKAAIKSRMKEEWDEPQEEQMKLWSTRSRRRSILHQNKSRTLNLFKHIFAIPAVIISSTLGLLNGISEQRYREVNIGLNFSITVMSAISFKYNFEKKSIEHSTASQRYYQLAEMIDSQLSKPREHRRDVTEFYCDIRNQYINLIRTSSPISIERADGPID